MASTQQASSATRARLAHEQMKEAQAERDAAIRDAVASGATLRHLATLLGLSHQRIAQIVKGG
jgi:hypothetical protein